MQYRRSSEVGGGENMSRKPYSWLVVVGMISLCIGLSGCGKNVDTVAESTVPIEIGEHVMYGSYQGEPVEWRVLDKKDREILLLSEYGLDAQPFDTSGKSRVDWKDSTIRKWLNDDFYNSAFSEKEKENIVESKSEGFEEYNTSMNLTGGGKPYAYLEREIEDKVFLLSNTELCAYFSEDPYPGCYSDPYAHKELLCYPTAYAKQQLETRYQTETCGWWLCNHVYEDDSVELVSAYGQGSGTSRENIKANTKSIAVRPAMWVTWQSDMEMVEANQQVE